MCPGLFLVGFRNPPSGALREITREAPRVDTMGHMTFQRLRVLRFPVLGSLLLAVGSFASAQTPAGQETSAASVASLPPVSADASRSRSRPRHAAERLALLRTREWKPARRAELRLVVKAGSVLEDDDQQGLAHFVEHMEFEGTQHFPRQSIVDFLSSLGLSIGPDANAATSYDDTQYTLRVPTDAPGVLDRALLVLEDWAGGAILRSARHRPGARHRAVGMADAPWRRGADAGHGPPRAARRIALRGPNADWEPRVIERAQREQLLRFYHDWYRPDLMAVIVVGDIDSDAAVGMIKEHFSGLSSPVPMRPRPAFDVPDHPGTRYTIVTDKETSATAVEVSELRPAATRALLADTAS